MGKCGILGGTFNPIHIGHLIIAEQAYSDFSLDRVLIMPSGNPYFKEKLSIPEGKIRLEMCRIAVEDNPHFEVSDIEVKREGRTYTYETLEELRALNPDDELFFICGADIIREIRLWKFPKRIFSACTILAAVRDNTDEEGLLEKIREYEAEYDAKIKVMHTGRMDISSTDLRRRVSENLSVKYYLPDGVIDYIRESQLYTAQYL